MADEITVASTTDEMEDVQAAAEATPEELKSGRLPERPEPEREAEVETEVEDNRSRPAKGAGFQRRIDQLTRQKYQDQDRIRQLEERLREIESSTAGEQARTEEPPRATEKPAEVPTPDQPSRPNDPTREQAQAYVEQVKTRFARDYEAALPKGSPERAELEEAAERTTAEVGGIHPGVAQVVMAMPNSIDVYAHLATHPDDLRVLNASRSAAEALSSVRYLSGVLRGMAQSQAPRPRPSVKRPPEPARPVRGGSSAATSSLDEADYQTYRRLRDQQEKNRYR